MDGAGAVDDGGITSVIIRTPDQKVRDLEIECKPQWTVANLKQHLSQLYPGNPTEDKQRLILAGKLLQDKTALEELFQMYEYKPIIHFVYTQSMMEPVSDAQPVPSSTSRSSLGSAGRASTGRDQTAAMPRQAIQIPGGNPRWSAHMSQLHMWHEQLQADSQHYLTQATLRTESPDREDEGDEDVEHVPEVPEQPPPQQPPQPAEQHDLLDVFYIIIRSLFLMALAWNYASPAKFCFMGVMLFYLYLYQTGLISLPQVFNRNQDESGEVGAEGRQMSAFAIIRNVVFAFFTSLLPSNENV